MISGAHSRFNSGRTIGFIFIAASQMLAACSSALATVPTPPSPSQPSISTNTPSPMEPLDATRESSPTPPVIPPSCNPFIEDYCVVSAYFVFQYPIISPGTDSVDRGYPYGSTEGGKRDPHHGVEFNNGSGTPVLAAADGMVYYAGDDTTRKFSPWSGFYGNIVVLEHSLSVAPFKILYTLYAHLSKIDVRIGQVVTAGERIGEVGLTGTASGSHLHFEVRVDPNDYASTLNPELWLVPHLGNGTLALLASDKSGTTIFPSFHVQTYPDRNQPATAAYQLDAISPDTVNARDPWNEIAALGDQPAGWYRITVIRAGILYEKWVKIETGKLTLVMFAME